MQTGQGPHHRPDRLPVVRDRLARYLVDEEGFEADVVAAVVPSAGGDPLDARARCAALGRLRTEQREAFEALAAGFKRAKNILKKDRADGEPEPSTEDAATEEAAPEEAAEPEPEAEPEAEPEPTPEPEAEPEPTPTPEPEAEAESDA